MLMNTLITSAITLLVGLTAFAVYIWQKHDNKKLAANAILFEIKNAERVIAEARNNLKKDYLSEELFAMQYESWTKYRHLFVKNFDRDEWNTITDFYNKCQLFDETVAYNKTFFQKNEEQIRVNKQRIVSDYTKEAVDAMMQVNDDDPDKEETAVKITEEFVEKTRRFDDTYMGRQDLVMYNPTKPVTDAKIYLADLTQISGTSVGIKLKKIAKVKP